MDHLEKLVKEGGRSGIRFRACCAWMLCLFMVLGVCGMSVRVHAQEPVTDMIGRAHV